MGRRVSAPLATVGGVEPTQALLSIETVLRLVVREVLGDEWLQAPGAPAERGLRRSHTRDLDRRHGVQLSDDLLQYTETRELTTIIRDNWERFEPVFQQKERTFGFLQVVDDERFSVAHSRELVPFERELLSGIAGQFRQQVALWRNRDDPSTSFYPRIERLTDNYGVDGREDHYRYNIGPLIRLEVGDVLTFRGSAFGDQQNPVLWYLSTGSSLVNFYGQPERHPVAEGDFAEFSWTVTEDEVGENLVVNILLDTSSRWKRHMVEPKYDDIRYFSYAVNPPRS